MKTLASVILVLLAACTEGSGKPDPTTALDYDAHFVALIGSYATPEDCLANEQQPFVCTFSISFCKNGRVGYRQGDIVYDGTYDLDGNIAHATFTGPGTFTIDDIDFDVVTPAQVGAPQAKWIVDTQGRWNTLQFDNIDCRTP
jgi:hypothetical protein